MILLSLDHGDSISLILYVIRALLSGEVTRTTRGDIRQLFFRVTVPASNIKSSRLLTHISYMRRAA